MSSGCHLYVTIDGYSQLPLVKHFPSFHCFQWYYASADFIELLSWRFVHLLIDPALSICYVCLFSCLVCLTTSLYWSRDTLRIWLHISTAISMQTQSFADCVLLFIYCLLFHQKIKNVKKRKMFWSGSSLPLFSTICLDF